MQYRSQLRIKWDHRDLLDLGVTEHSSVRGLRRKGPFPARRPRPAFLQPRCFGIVTVNHCPRSAVVGCLRTRFGILTSFKSLKTILLFPSTGPERKVHIWLRDIFSFSSLFYLDLS